MWTVTWLLYSQIQELVGILQREGTFSVCHHRVCDIKGPLSHLASESLPSWLVVSEFLQGQLLEEEKVPYDLFSNCWVEFWVSGYVFQGVGEGKRQVAKSVLFMNTIARAMGQ